MIRGLLAGLALLLAASCARPAPIIARPALWEVQGGGRTAWLLGTVHALPPEVAWRTPAIRAAITRADRLALELPDDQPAIDATFARAAAATDLPLAERLPPRWRQAVAAAIDRMGITPDGLDHRATWAAATALAAADAERDGADAGRGVDRALAATFRAAGKPRIGLETPAEQFAAFDTLPPPAQRALLRNAAREILASHGFATTLAAWSRGDTTALAAATDAGLAGPPALRTQLLTDRNRRFADRLAVLMRQPGTLLVAIGAGHLVGPDSVVALLARRGYRVRRVE